MPPHTSSGRGPICDAANQSVPRSNYDWRRCCIALLPCLNEEHTIGQLVRDVRAYFDAALVIDDGSHDRTAAVAKEAGAIVLRNERPAGKGAALRQGWNWALDHGYRWALNLDGDGQHRPEDIPSFLACAQSTGAQLIIGNRMQNPNGMPPLRRWVNRWMSGRLSALAGTPLPDSQCGFRLMDLSQCNKVNTTTTHFEIESEVLLSFVRAGSRVEFVAIRTVYNQERSKIHPVSDTVRWFRWWARARNPRRTR